MSNYDDRYDGESDKDCVSWITWFCELKGNELFCMVDNEFIADDFNLTGLSSMVSFYQYALDVIQDQDTLDNDRFTEEQKRLVESSAETLYGLIHARFITTNRGLKLMEDKFVQGEFGCCPRVFCSGQAVLPVGQSDVVRESSVKLFCPKCEDIYYPRSSRHKTLDGAFWGTTFPHLLLLQMRENGYQIAKTLKPHQEYIPRIYGFRICRPGSPFQLKEREAVAGLSDNDEDANNDGNNNSGTLDKGGSAASGSVQDK